MTENINTLELDEETGIILRPEYPDTPIWDDEMPFDDEVLDALKIFKRRYPYSLGSYEQRQLGMLSLHVKLCEFYGKTTELLFRVTDDPHSFGSHYNSSVDKLVMSGKLSIITYLHEFAHVLGMDERDAVKWSLSLFKRVYPIAFERLHNVHGHCLVQENPKENQEARTEVTL